MACSVDRVASRHLDERSARTLGHHVLRGRGNHPIFEPGNLWIVAGFGDDRAPVGMADQNRRAGLCRQNLLRGRHVRLQRRDDMSVTIPSAAATSFDEFLVSLLPLGGDGLIVTSRADADERPIRDYQVVDTTNTQEGSRVFNVKGVREEITKNYTDTTFLLAEDGLYVIRRPAVEAVEQFHASAYEGE